MREKKRNSRYSIRLKLQIVYMALLILTAVTMFTFFAFRFQRAYRQQADSHMADMTSMATANMDGRIEQIDQLSVSILIDQEVQRNLKTINEAGDRYNEKTGEGSVSANESAISRQVRGSVFNIEGIISLRIYPVNGEEIFVGTTNREYIEYSMTAEEIYEAGGSALWGIAGEDHYICMGRAILSTEDMQPLGYMVIICKNGYLSDKLATVPGPASSAIYLVDDDGRITASSGQDSVGEIFPCSREELLSGERETVKDPVLEETSYFYLGQTMENGWSMITTVSARYFREGIFVSLLQTTAVVMGALLLSFILTKAAIRRLMAPTENLLKNMSDFGSGKLDARAEVQGNDEIGQISGAYNQMADNIQNLMEKVYMLELANKEAEIEVLKMQINPHFLYNTLDTISWLGYGSGNEDITEISVSLAKLLRASIRRTDMVTVEEELRTVECYLVIQGYRFADKFAVEKKIDKAALACYMPSFLLQPLIENSIIHGLEGQMEKGTLTIEIRRGDESLRFCVRDDGAGMEEEKLKQLREQCRGTDAGKSIGLANVYRRLQLLYGAACDFEIVSTQGKGTAITFCIPVMLKKEEQNEE